MLVWLLYRADFPRSYRSAVRNTCDSHLQVMHRTTQATHKAISETNSHKMIKAGKVHLFLLSPSYTYYRNRLMLSMALDRVHAHLLFFFRNPLLAYTLKTRCRWASLQHSRTTYYRDQMCKFGEDQHTIRKKNSIFGVTTAQGTHLRCCNSADMFCTHCMLGIIIRQIFTFGHDDWTFCNTVGKPISGDFQKCRYVW